MTESKYWSVVFRTFLLRGGKSWNVNEPVRKNLETTKMWFVRRKMGILWPAEVTNKDCMETADGIIALLTTIREIRTSLISYIMRIYNENCGIGEEPTRSSSKLTRRDNKPKIVQGQPKWRKDRQHPLNISKTRTVTTPQEADCLQQHYTSHRKKNIHGPQL